MSTVFTPKGRLISVATVLTIGLGLSIGLFFLVQGWEERQIAAEFTANARDRVYVVRNAFEDHLDLAEAVTELYNASTRVEREEFGSFVGYILKKHPDILALDWIPRVPGAERPVFESEMQKNGFADFQIKEFDPSLNFQKASERFEYFPVAYIEPLSHNRFLAGYDEGSDRLRLQAIEKARDTGRPAATSQIKLKRDPRAAGCRVFFPLYRKGSTPDTVDARRQSLVGFTSLLMDVPSAFVRALRGLSPAGIDVYLYDETGEGPSRIWAFLPSRSLAKEGLGKARGEEGRMKLSYRESFLMADQRWTIVCQPGVDFWPLHKIWQAWVVFLTGCFLILFLGIYILNILVRMATVKREVDQRTAELRQLNEEWRRTFDSISDWIFIQDKDHVIRKVNKAFAQAIRMSPEQIIGKKCFDLVHGTFCPLGNCPFEETKKDHKSHTIEIDDPRIGVPLLVTTSPVFDEGGELAGSVHIAKNISHMKEAEREKQKAAELKVAFTSMVSHELRTPLTAIKEGVNILLDGAAGEVKGEQKEFLLIAKRNVDRLSRLINNVLDFQKLDAGKEQFFFQENDINDCVREVQETLGALAEKKGLNLFLDPGPDLPKIRFDKDKISQVLTNLVNNAIKFTESGQIIVSTRADGNILKVSVSDTGPGILPENMPKLFRQFEQLASMQERKTGGSGLGLAISRQIIEQHGGRIWAESIPGQGTVFCFTLPVKERPEGNG